MGAALEAACAAPGSDFDAEACGAVRASWHCPADIRLASRVGARWTDEVIVMVPMGGMWFGAVFRRAPDWKVVSLTGGDIP